MSKRTPAVTTQLKTALVEIEALKKRLENSEAISRHHSSRAAGAEAELQQIHAFLDAVPVPPGRKTQHGDYGATTEHSAMTRLSVYLATRTA